MSNSNEQDKAIAQWYEAKARKANKLWYAILWAEAIGASPKTIKELERLYEQACYVGD